MNESGLGSIEDFAQVARDLHAEQDETETLQIAVDAAVKLIPNCDHAGVTIVTGRAITFGACSDETVRRGDELQYTLNEGPCLDSVREHQTVVSQNLVQDPRWPRWSRRVHDELGVRAMLALLLYTTDRSYGALNLYADEVGAWDAEDHAVAQVLAAQIAVSVATSREIDQRTLAMINRTVIGQAQGILMERLGISADQAFAYLRRVSQETNRKLVTICSDLVDTRQLPG